MKLAVAPLLRTLVPKHGSAVPEPLYLIEQQAMLKTRPHTAGSALRPQGEAVTIAVLEGIHLLFDDIRDLADGAFEQVGHLQDGHTDLVVTIPGEHPTHPVLEKLPQEGLVRQDVFHPTNGLDLLRHRLNPCIPSDRIKR